MKPSLVLCLLGAVLFVRAQSASTVVCPEDWTSFQGRCYYYNTVLLDWHDADAACADLDASLVSVHSPQEYYFLYKQSTRFGFSPSWIGGIYFVDQWMWLDGSWFRQGFFDKKTVCHGAGSLYPCLATYGPDGWCNYLCSATLRSFCVKDAF